MGLTIILTRSNPNFLNRLRPSSHRLKGVSFNHSQISWKKLVLDDSVNFFEEMRIGTQLAFNCSNSTTETPQQCVKSVPSQQ